MSEAPSSSVCHGDEPGQPGLQRWIRFLVGGAKVADVMPQVAGRRPGAPRAQSRRRATTRPSTPGRTRLVLALAVAGFLVALAGCGDDSTSASSTTTTATASTTPGTVTPTTPGSQPAGPTSGVSIPQVSGYTDETADGNLRQGLRGARVLALQKKLKALGYDVGTPDGLFGAKTRAAVVKFQTDKSLGVDGIVGPKTLAALDAACQAQPGCAAA